MLSHDQQPGGIFIDAVNDARSQDTIDAGQGVCPGVHQPVDQCVILMSGSGVNHQTLRLIDDDDILILIDDFQFHGCSPDIQGFRLRQLHPDHITWGGAVILFCDLTVDGYMAALQQILGTTAAESFDASGQENIQPLIG